MFSQDSHFWGTFKKFRLFSLLEQKGWDEKSFCFARLVIPNLCVRPHSLPLQEEGFTGFMRTLRGRDQEKVIRKKEELWGRPCREGERGTAHFVIALWPLTPPSPTTTTPSKGPMSTDMEDSMTSTKGYFFIPGLSRLLRHQQSTYSPTDHSTLFVFNSFFFFFHGFPDGQNWHRQIRWFPPFFFVFFFLPRHCDCISEKLHPILYLCNTTPAQLPQGGRCATPTYAAVNKGHCVSRLRTFIIRVQVVLYELFMSPVQDHSEYSFRKKTPHNTRVSTSSYHWVL